MNNKRLFTALAIGLTLCLTYNLNANAEKEITNSIKLNPPSPAIPDEEEDELQEEEIKILEEEKINAGAEIEVSIYEESEEEEETKTSPSATPKENPAEQEEDSPLASNSMMIKSITFTAIEAMPTQAEIEHTALVEAFHEDKDKPRKSIFLNDYATDKSPRLFGIGVLDSRLNTEVFVKDLSLKTPNSPLEGFMPGIVGKTMSKLGQKVEPIDTHNQVDMVKADIWVFPFLNAYVLAGHLKGRAPVTSTFSNWNSTDPETMMLKDIAEAQGAKEIMPFVVDYSGNTLGFGFTLAYGAGNWFTTIDYNYVQTDLAILEGYVKAQTLTLLGGYNVTNKLNVYAGASSTDIAQKVSGSIPDGMLPPDMDENMLGKDATFELEAKSKATWIPTLGASYSINEHFNANLTGSFDSQGKLTGQTLGLGYRF